ncbi:MAG: sigma-70 family RNA polymerase sigma factor [Clostridiales bacterium]|jgi:RNA polymerase sigma-70 factor (ECF subfamily)|nr:sigma-70 family RNA polymerase sigma factor [Clostridiales bacterium]
MSPLTDYELIQSCLQGNQDSFAELIARYKNLVYSVILRMVNDREEANDLAQDVFLKLYKNLDKYYPDYKFSTWTIRIATNHVIDYRRRKKQETVSMEEVEYELGTDDSPENAYIRQEQKQELNQMLVDLPDMYKIPIVLYHEQDLSYQEIADIIHEPLSKVKNRIFRGRRMLKESLLNLRKKEQAGYGV